MKRFSPGSALRLAVTFAVVLAALEAVPGRATEPADAAKAAARALLDNAVAASREVTSARYHARTSSTGIAADFAAPAEGWVYIEGWRYELPERFHIDVTTRPLGASETVHLTAGGDGESYFLIDHAGKRAYEDMDPAVLGSSATTLLVLSVPALISPEPYAAELAAVDLAIAGEAVADGEPCVRLEAELGGGLGRVVWFLSKNDWLPRRFEQHFSNPAMGDGTFITEIRDLELNVDAEPGLFRLRLPEGYERIDDFAP